MQFIKFILATALVIGLGFGFHAVFNSAQKSYAPGLPSGSWLDKYPTDTVIRVIDGDTIITKDFGRVRFYECNAAELHTRAGKRQKMLLESDITTTVYIIPRGYDVYDRVLANVYTSDHKPLCNSLK